MQFYKVLLAFVVVLGLSFNLSAQLNPVFSFRNSPSLTRHSNNNSLRVIDERINKDSLGYLRVGGFNRKKVVTTQEPLTKVLSDQFYRIIENNADQDSGELLMVLYEFSIEDCPTKEKVGTLFLDADFYTGDSKNRYRYLGTVDSLYEITSDWDLSDLLMKATENKLSDLLIYITQLEPDKNKYFTEEELLLRRTKQKQALPIYNTAPDFKKGIYFTLEQFINNAPVDTPFIIRQSSSGVGPKTILVYYPKSSQSKAVGVNPETMFAAFDGSQWVYGADAHKYSFMEYKNSDFYVVKQFKGWGQRLENNSAFYYVAFGVVGGLLHDALSSATHETTGKSKWYTYYARFDPRTQAFIPIRRAK